MRTSHKHARNREMTKKGMASDEINEDEIRQD